MRPYQALDLLMSTAYAKDSALTHPGMYLDHVEGVAAVAFLTAYKMREKGIDIDPDFLRTVATVHDIGRTRREAYKTGDTHEYWTGELLRRTGYPEEADVAQRHFVAAKKVEYFGLVDPDGRPVKSEDYRQVRLPEKVLTYADSSVGSDGSKGNWRDKLDSLIPKYSSGKRRDPAMVEILSYGGIEWLRGICEEVDRMLEV